MAKTKTLTRLINAPEIPLSDNLVAEKPTCENYGDAVNDFLTSLGLGQRSS